MEHNFNGINSLTSAKILVETKRMNRIEECIKIQWQTGSCWMWVKEKPYCECSEKINEDTEDIDEQEVVSPVQCMGWKEGVCNDGEGNHANDIEGPAEQMAVRKVTNGVREENEANNSVQLNTMVLTGAQQQVSNVQATTGVREEFEQVVERHERICNLGDNSTEKVKEAQGVVMAGLEDENRNEVATEMVKTAAQQVLTSDLVKNKQVHAKEPLISKVVQQQLEGSVNVIEDSSIVVVPNTAQARMQDNVWFDPILSVECANNNGTNLGTNPLRISSSLPQKRPRGRPKRTTYSLPEPLYVPSTPSKSELEAMETWNIAKLLGVKSPNERAVISALRKSKRLLVLEENNPSG